MSEAHPTAEPTPPLTPDQEQLGFHRDILDDFADTARAFGHLLLDTAKRTSHPAQILRLALAFEQVSRGGRRAILLCRQIGKPETPEAPHAPPRPAPTPNPAPPPLTPPNPQRPQSRDTIGRPEPRDRADAADQVDSIADLAHRPVHEVVTLLKRDLDTAFQLCSEPLAAARPSLPAPHHPTAEPIPAPATAPEHLPIPDH